MSVKEIYGAALDQAGILQANTFASTIFTLRDGKYEGKPLPAEAQLTPAFAVCIGDADGDGAEDLFLSQNFFALPPAESRCDAGRGLWLKGDGRGGLVPISGQESGVLVYGEQRGSALGDYDSDGRVDLAVAQNGNETKLFHNVGAKPGLRIRLRGPRANPTGVGCRVRLESQDGQKGPVREVQAGSGYWSQNSAVQVMSLPNGHSPAAIWVQWPGGKTSRQTLPTGAMEIEISVDP